MPNKNQDFVEEKFKNIDSDQIEGAEFRFLGLETRFGRNKSLDFRDGISNFDFQFPRPNF